MKVFTTGRLALGWPRLGGAAAALCAVLLGQAELPGAVRATPFRVAAQMRDLAEPAAPDEVRLRGYLGDRVLKNESARLVKVDVDRLLQGFRKKPGEHPWIGEHIGKWLHAATLAWVNTGDAELKRKLDYAAAELIKTQEPDGYLGTYVPEKRFGLYQGADWDVWSHKYNLMGLVTYHQYTGDARALEACRKMADLLDRTFGPGKKSILAAGTHVGMASTSVLEPMVLLYRFTGEPRYLEFCKYIVRAWDEPRGPRVMSTLLAEKSVQKTANGKAYEMLSNLVGLCELARASGEERYLQTAVNAWEDVVRNQLYITGTASHHEHFHAPHELPNGESSNVGETCVTTTWIQLNLQLLRLTGEARYGDELERSYYNHLSAAQRPDGAQWCYYTALEGRKPYGPGINCCVSSGPRGMALAPQAAYFRYRAGADAGVAVNLFETSTFTLGGAALRQETDFPRAGSSRFTLSAAPSGRLALKIRAPEWARPLKVRVNGKDVKTRAAAGWVELPARRWRKDDRVELSFRLEGRQLAGAHTNAGRAALLWGPLVLAYDEQRNPGLPIIHGVGLPERAGVRRVSDPGQPLRFRSSVRTAAGGVKPATFVPFAIAGEGGGRYRVWLKGPGAPLDFNRSLLASGREGRSRPGNVDGSIQDGLTESFVVTFNNELHAEDWYSVELDRPAAIKRVVYAHGKTFHDGGWFDTAAGKPRIQARLTNDGPWTDLGILEGYPAATATDPKDLRSGQEFTLRLAEPVRVVAVRVVGKPAGGDNPKQAFSSCAELQAFPD